MNVLLVDQTGLCINVICADSVERAQAFYPDCQCIVQQPTDPYGPGWTFSAGAWTPAAIEAMP